jgi:hypothetical protein
MEYGGGVAAVIACLGVAIFGDNAKRDVAAKGLATTNKANEESTRAAEPGSTP